MWQCPTSLTALFVKQDIAKSVAHQKEKDSQRFVLTKLYAKLERASGALRIAELDSLPLTARRRGHPVIFTLHLTFDSDKFRMSDEKDSLRSCGGFFLALNRLCNTRFMGFDFAGIIGFGFAIGENSLEDAS